MTSREKIAAELAKLPPYTHEQLMSLGVSTRSIQIRKLGELAVRRHYACEEDSWYSCPKDVDGCSDRYPKGVCNCGADTHNEKVAALLVELCGAEKG